MADPNLDLLEDAAAKLTPLLREVVFIGGATLGLLVTDAGAAPVRGTIDVDVIAEITTYVDYIAFSSRLQALGFAQDAREDAPVCRWVNADLKLDVMPLEKSVFGFSNIWYRGALEAAHWIALPSGAEIRIITAPFFLATKMEAFRGRGRGDFFASHDLEDFIAVVDGRDSLLDELASARPDVRAYLSNAAKELLAERRFRDALPGYLLPDEISQNRSQIVVPRLREMAGFDEEGYPRNTQEDPEP